MKDVEKPGKRTTYMPRNTFDSKSQVKKKAKAESVVLNQTIKEKVR